MKIERNRLRYAIITAIVIAVGLASRSSLADSWPTFLSAYTGDTLWSLMIFLILGTIFPTLRTLPLAIIVLLISYTVEVTQLYQADWINSFRKTFVGAMALGSGFLWSDFICYTTGCAIGAVTEWVTTRRQWRSNTEESNSAADR